MTRLRVLFVDDEPAILRAIGRLFKHEEVDAFFENDAQHALEVLRDGRFDIVVSDANMPGMNGIAFLDQARHTSPQTMRVLMTGSQDRQVAIDAVNEAHIDGFLEKPWPTGAIQALIARLAPDAMARRASIAPNPSAAVKSFGKL